MRGRRAKSRKISDANMLLLAIILIAVYLLFIQIETSPDMYVCSSDSDCISKQADCCGCNSGGKAIAINKNYESLYNDKMLNECKGMMCLTVISNDPSCFAEPMCVFGTCKLV